MIWGYVDKILIFTDRFVSAGVSPFNTKFQGIMRQIEDYEQEVDKDKSLLESEGILSKSIFFCSGINPVKLVNYSKNTTMASG